MFGRIPNVATRRLAFAQVVAGAVVLAIGVAVAIRVYRNRMTALQSVTIPASRKRIEGEVIALRPTGFEPAQINRPVGPFLLLVNNYGKLEEAVLLLDKNDGSVVRKVSLLRETRIWSETIDLPPGSYTLREASHNWVCHIVIH